MVSWQIVKVGKRTIRQEDHAAEVVVALRSEATGAVLKVGQTLRVVPRAIPATCPLSPMELQVLDCISNGLTYKQAAAKRERAVSTIRTHIHSIYRKLGVNDRSQAVLKAVAEGWL